MDYGRFVSTRSPLWDELEAGLERLARRRRELSHEELEALALRYRQVLHDHALAAARFPETAATRRLARLSLAATHRLVHREARGRRGPLHFVARTFPGAFRRHLPALGVAAALFAGGAVLGLFLAAVRPGLATAFLGPERVAGLERGELWTESLVTTTPPAIASSGIATNNLGVALTSWAGGATAGLVTLYVLLLNGFMLGALTGVTLHYGMAGALLEFVAAHGVLEITLILVASAAGLELARGLVGEGDRPRAETLGRAGRDSLRVLLGCLPWFVLLAVVETLVSPAPAVAAGTKLALGLALEAAFFALALNPGGRVDRPVRAHRRNAP
ncbi:MAG: stage II sporulation protein M [Thermoanaerobaculia bacterium]